MSWAAPLAAAFVALLAWDAFRRWLESRRADNGARIDAFEQALSEHKALHAAAIKNVAQEVREEVAGLRTRVSAAEQKAGPSRGGLRLR